MATLKDLGESRGTLINFDPRKIAIEPGFNARDLTTPEARAHIEFLKASIRGVGYLPSHPLEIRQKGDQVLLTSGHCRLTAVLELIAEGVEIPTIPTVGERRGTNDVDRFLAQNLDNSGLRLTPLEEARNIKRAIDLGATVGDIAKRVGRSTTFVSQALDFMSAPQEVHNLVKEGAVTATFAARTIRKAGAEKGTKVLRKAVAEAKSQGKTKASAKHVKADLAAANERKAGRADDIPIKVTGSVITVTFMRTEVMFPAGMWAAVAKRILDAAEGVAVDAWADDADPRPTLAERDMVAEATREAEERAFINKATEETGAAVKAFLNPVDAVAQTIMAIGKAAE